MDRVEDVTALLEEMKQYLSYDSETGHFTWIKKYTCKTKLGNAGRVRTTTGQIVLKLNETEYQVPRLAWLFTYGKWPDNHVFHIDNNKENNKIDNLQINTRINDIEDVTALLEEMKKYLSYDPETGDFTWIRTRCTRQSKLGIAGHVSKGYIRISFNSKEYFAHRLAWLFTHGRWPYDQIDHIDVNRKNNRINNLREVSNQENQFNKIRAKVGSTSDYLGVSRTKNNRWVAQIQLNRKNMSLGTYDTPELASEAYQAAKLKYHVIGNANES